jgi:choline-glycine betaine transporter
MSHTFQPKKSPSCKSYVDQIYKLKRDLDAVKTFNEQFKKETIFLRWSIAFALGIGFIVGVITKGHL